MSNLHQRRHKREETVKVLDELLRSIHHSSAPNLSKPTQGKRTKAANEIPISWLVTNRNRLLDAGMDLAQAQELNKRLADQTKTERENTRELVGKDTPIERIVEYISAPRDIVETSHSGALQETLYNQIIADHYRANAWDLKSLPMRAGFLAGAAAFVGSVSLIIIAATASSMDLAQQSAHAGALFGHINRAMWGILDAVGVPVMEVFSQDAPLGQLTVYCGALAYSEYLRKKGLASGANLREKLHQPSHGVAEELFHQSKIQDLDRAYENLTESDKHLLNHLSPHELRVVLVGGEGAARSILEANPPPFSSHVLAAAHSANGWGDHFAKMIHLSLPVGAQKLVSRLSSGILEAFGDLGDAAEANPEMGQLLGRLEKRRTGKPEHSIALASTTAPGLSIG